MLTSPRVALLGALLGAFASAYLLVDYVFGSGICLTGSGCDAVRDSAFAYPLGIPMPLLGLGFYLAAITILLIGPGSRLGGVPAATLAVAWSLLGVGVMAVLTAIELFVIGALCSWCLLSTLASVVLAGGAIATWRRREAKPPDAARSSRARRRQSADLERSTQSLRRFTARTAALFGVVLLALLAVPPITSGTPVDGAPVGSVDRPHLGSGRVEVVVFSDFQCPACAAAAPALSQLADEDDITLTYRYFPLTSIHANAAAAAEAAQAAAMQGRFWEFHDALFARQASWADVAAGPAAAAFEAIAGEVGLDVARWRQDAGSSAVSDVVAEDARAAGELQLTGTPTIFVDGTRYGGRLSYEELRSAVQQAAAAY